MITIEVCISDGMGPRDILGREIPINFRIDKIPCKRDLKMNKEMFKEWLFIQLERDFPITINRDN
jgi:hypothetical protein